VLPDPVGPESDLAFRLQLTESANQASWCCCAEYPQREAACVCQKLRPSDRARAINSLVYGVFRQQVAQRFLGNDCRVILWEDIGCGGG
jgi:hypothetical protein